MFFIVLTRLCDHYTHSFIGPKRNAAPINSHSLFSPPPSPWQLLICFLSLHICLFWTFHINGIVQYVGFGFWLLSLSLMFSRFIHVVANVITYSFLMLNNISLYRHKLHFVYPWTCGHRDCFYFLDIMKNATMNIHIQVLLWTCVFISLGYIGVEFLYHVVTL